MKNSESTDKKEELIHQCLLYHVCLLDLYTDKTVPLVERNKDIFWYIYKGSSDKERIHKSVIKGTYPVNKLTDEDMRSILKKMIEKNISVNSSRKKTTWIDAIALSAFYNQQVPSMTKELSHEIDHIVPFSLRKSVKIDICRLGNKQIIPSKINAVRKIKPITDKWISENKLMYQNYPNEQEYANIINDDINEELFNSMCERREHQYIEHIIKSYCY
jgi:hypothetical protein